MDDGYSHQQARLTTGTVAHNDKLPTDFRHLDEGGRLGERMGESEGSRYGRAPRVFTGEEVRDSSAEGMVLQMGNSSVVGSCRRAAHGDGGGRSHRGWVVGASGRQECTGQIHRPKGLPCTSPPRMRGDGTCNDTRRYLSPGAPPAWVCSGGDCYC